ncbi:MAG: lytic murein transglycosylase [Vicinamibacterales bacterium]
MRGLTATLLILLGTTLAAQDPSPAPASDVRPSFTEWLEAVRTEAVARGISAATVASALSDIPEPMPVVIERDRTQAETVLPLDTYIERHLRSDTIRRGREMTSRYRRELDEVASDYGVPAPIIAGIWGIESNFGSFSGSRPTIPALATLAYDPRRSTLFRRELFAALEIVDRGDIEHRRMRGSWAGAMGQPQFMPSSYLDYAVDYDGDGRKDIWTTAVDVFASIGNYLSGHGWASGQPWVQEVATSKDVSTTIAADIPRRTGSCSAKRDMTVAKTLSEWQEIGVRTVSGRSLPQSAALASLVSGVNRTFLVFENYDALLEYNCAHAYALSVALLGERIYRGQTTPLPTAAPRKGRAPRGPL